MNQKFYLGILIGFLMYLGSSDSFAGTKKCFSCRIVIKTLDKPISLHGTWKFTRNDDPKNADPNHSIKSWPLVEAPGKWAGVYPDNKVFKVGWYRGNLIFDKSLIGQEVVLLMDAYMSRLNFYLDGENVFQRTGLDTYEKYYSIQPIPIKFKITKRFHSIAFRIDSMIMTGVYQLPFQLRKFQKNDYIVSLFHFWGGEFRFIASFIVVFYGLFFLLVYLKTRATIYLIAGFSGIFIYPFYGLPSDLLIKFVRPETLQLLHYTGIGSLAAFHGFYAQFFYKFYPRFNKINLFINLIFVGIFIGFNFHFDLLIFQYARKILFFYSLLVACHYMYILAKGAQRDRNAVILLIGEGIMWASSIHDTLLALGLIQSISLLFFGTVVATASILFVSSTIFANTYVENRKLINGIEQINRNLEGMVSQRTAQLKEKSQDVLTILESLPQGVLMITEDMLIHKEYSKYLIEILEIENIADQNVIEILFKKSQLNTDQIDQIHHSLECCIGNWSVNFEANADLLPIEIEYTSARGTKILSLIWSPIVNSDDVVDKVLLCIRDMTEVKQLEESAARQQREMDIIAQLLAVEDDKFWRFFKITNQHIEDSLHNLDSDIAENEKIKSLFRHIHTIKGNSRTLNFTYITQSAHHIESRFVHFKNTQRISHAIFITELNELREIMNEYSKIAKEKLRMHEHQLHLGTKIPLDLLDILDIEEIDDLDKMKHKLGKLKESIRSAFFVSIDETLSDLLASIPNLAGELMRLPPQILIEGGDLLVDPEIANVLSDVMGHLLKNSIDHGIESPAERLAGGKPSVGVINLRFWEEHNSLNFVLKDDGRGLDLKKIRNKCQRLGLSQMNAKTEVDIANAIFENGFSIKEAVSQISGRGIGLDAVRQFMRKMNGEIKLEILGPSVGKNLNIQFSGNIPKDNKRQKNEDREIQFIA